MLTRVTVLASSAIAIAVAIAGCLFPSLDGLGDGGVPDANGVDVLPDAIGDGGIHRPPYNHGVGFYVLDGKLYDANDNEFRVRGVNKVHWDAYQPGLDTIHANAVRWNIDFTRAPSDNVALLQGATGAAGTTTHDVIVVPTMFQAGDAGLNCTSDPTALTAATNLWTAQVSSWTQLEKVSILNIAEQWGLANSSLWRDAYIAAIASLRSAGYHATLMVTAGGCGQDVLDIANYAQAVLAGDPEQNVIFDLHVYGAFPDATTLNKGFSTLAAVGVPIVIGEFGPGNDIGPSPTNLTPQDVIQTAEQYGFGWMAWAFDDDNLAGAQANNEWFALSYLGNYQASADLTMYGQEVVEGCTNSAPGGCGCPDSPPPDAAAVEPGCTGLPAATYSGFSLKQLAKPATVF